MVTTPDIQPFSSVAALRAGSGAYKRPLDLIILVGAHVILAPLFLSLWIVIPVLIVLDSGWPIFYRQRRIGRHGQVFHALKFRTMVRDADIIGPVNTAEDDHRITRVGRILRGTGLDELPQVVNILFNDMSFVGPRPLAEREYRTLASQIPGFQGRLRVHAGLTGLAQVYADRDDATEKLRHDLAYAQSFSLWLDVKLLFLSVWITIRGTWESRQSKF